MTKARLHFLSYSVRRLPRGVEVHDQLTDEPEGDHLQAQRQDQNAEQKDRPVGDSLAHQPLHEEDEKDDGAGQR